MIIWSWPTSFLGEFSQKILGKTITFREGELCLIDKNCLHQDIMDTTPASYCLFVECTL